MCLLKKLESLELNIGSETLIEEIGFFKLVDTIS